jgi:hypothetical protein
MKRFRIYVDEKPYRGESEVIENAPSRAVGWTGKAPATRNGIVIGRAIDPAMTIEGCRNLKSHLERITNRIDDLNCRKITILVVSESKESPVA